MQDSPFYVTCKSESSLKDEELIKHNTSIYELDSSYGSVK